MALFSSNKSNTQNTTNYNITDQSANAAEGAIAAGAGATVNVQTVDKDIALGSLVTQRDTAGMALAANQNVSLGALDTTARVAGGAIDLAGVSIAAQNDLAAKALASNTQVNRDSLDTTSRLALGAINTVSGLAEISARERQDVLNTTTTALQSQRGLSEKIAELASGALERTQTPDSQVTKQLLWAVVAIVGLVALFAFGSSRKKATA